MSVLWSVLAGIGTVLLFLLKGVGILLLVVLVLGLLLMFCPFCADVQWAEGIFQVKAGALGITFPVFRYPAPEKPEKKEKKKKASGGQKPKKEAPPRQKAKLTLQIICTILKGAGKLTRAIIGSLRFTRIDVEQLDSVNRLDCGSNLLNNSLVTALAKVGHAFNNTFFHVF